MELNFLLTKINSFSLNIFYLEMKFKFKNIVQS